MNEKNGKSILLLIPFIFAGIILSIILKGWVLSILWSWFIVPTLGLPILSIPIAIGISIVVGLLTHQYNDFNTTDTKMSELIGKSIGHSIIGPLLTLFVGWVVHSFI